MKSIQKWPETWTLIFHDQTYIYHEANTPVEPNLEGRSWCQNDPGRGSTSSGAQKAAILHFQDGRHVNSTSANISACRPLRRPILVSKCPLSHIAFATVL